MPRFDQVSNEKTLAQTGPSAQDTEHLQYELVCK